MHSTCLIFLLLVELAVGQSDFGALIELKKGIQKDPSGVLDSWDSKSLASDGCPENWFGIICSEGHVISITLNDLGIVGDFHFTAITGLKMLQNLSVSNNLFTGTIEDVGSIESLAYLDLSHNAFHGLIPSDLTHLENLVLLNLSSNNFEGKGPTGFGDLEKLKYIDFRANGFSGDIMRLLSELGSVVHVDLSSNQFSGSLDLGLGKSSFVSSIQYFNISCNSLVGQLFAHDGMPYFDSLEVFDASNNQLVGAIPSFNFVVSLQILRLGRNHLTGSLPEALFQESSMILSELDLGLNQLEGPVGSITSATLKNLNLSSNRLTGLLPARVGHCSIIDLSNNMLSGNLSRMQSWGNYVEIIDLSSNKLTGTLPNQTSQFLRLISLKLSNNSLGGSLPPVLGTYQELKAIPDIPSIDSTQNLSLVSLDLSGNSLSGHLPQEISGFHELVYLNLSNNLFEGSIPDDLPDGLKGFSVSYNNLSGIVPENLRRFPDSAFHPGNSLLAFPHSPSSSNAAPDLDLRGQGSSHMKPAVRAALIAGLVGGVSMIALLFVMICYGAHWVECSRDSLKGNGMKKGTEKETSSDLHTSALHKILDPSITSSSFPQDNTSSSHLGYEHEHGIISLVTKKPSDGSPPEPIREDEGISSPISLLSPSNPSPSKSPYRPDENPDVLKVCSPDKLAGDLHLFDGSLVVTSEELSHAPAEVIGRSCHGTLYKATLDSGHVLAVKWLREGIAKGRKEFSREAKKLGNIKHPNLVSLQGYYWGLREHEKLIISNFINAPCLALYLHQMEPRKFPPLSLVERLKIARDVACCLNFLHNERAIPHGNLKSTNILLETRKLNALLTDYSLHRIMTPAGTAEQVLNAGALGYRPPEFASSSKPCPSLKSDVYAYGVILLELLTGKSSGEIVSGNTGVVDLTEWVRWLAAENRWGECFDRLIPGMQSVDHPPRCLHEMLQVALKCILPASERPDMRTVYEDISSVVL
ncbi:putative inactive receptor kinase [Vitis vinifera]|uniref:Putative inactive receptor kinase n=1 Tax=Vitis vinifera TaxID=29760 RepID=A0A438FLW6_VITVI|nr:putative inactive receptor kinase [Vitis vinifera]